MKMDRKAGLLETTMGKVVLAVIILVVIIGMIWVTKGKIGEIWRGLSRIIRFGS
jgi:uncharacterized protein YybS (DUF2232 family)